MSNAWAENFRLAATELLFLGKTRSTYLIMDLSNKSADGLITENNCPI